VSGIRDPWIMQPAQQAEVANATRALSREAKAAHAAARHPRACI
jgi:hypothetical protein